VIDKAKKNETALCLFVYNRYEHLKVTLSRLLEFDLGEFDLLIFCDGPKDAQDSIKTNEVRKLINDSVAEMPNASVIESQQNMGLANSIFSGLNSAFESYEMAIVLEDDILIKPGFLEFMNTALYHYRHDSRIAGVAGFSYLTNSVRSNYFLPIGTSWGWGSWARVWRTVKDDPGGYLTSIRDKGLSAKFDYGKFPFLNILKGTVEGKNSSWAIQFYAQFFLDEKLFFFPNVSLCENIGFDGSGTHTGSALSGFNSSDYSKRLDRTFPKAIERDSRIERMVKKKLHSMSGASLKNRMFGRVKNLVRKHGRQS